MVPGEEGPALSLALFSPAPLGGGGGAAALLLGLLFLGGGGGYWCSIWSLCASSPRMTFMLGGEPGVSDLGTPTLYTISFSSALYGNEGDSSVLPCLPLCLVFSWCRTQPGRGDVISLVPKKSPVCAVSLPGSLWLPGHRLNPRSPWLFLAPHPHLCLQDNSCDL